MNKFNIKFKGLYFSISLFLSLINFNNRLNCQSISEKLSGIIRIKDGEAFQYEINYKLDSIGNLSGYSIFNPNKVDETKSMLKGTLKNDKLEFKEYKILSTKSKDPIDKMCLIHYNGKFKKIFNAQMMVGEFKGFYSNGKQCGSGSLNLLAREKYLLKMDSAMKVKPKNKKNDTAITPPIVNPLLKFEPISKTDNSITNINWTSDTIYFKLWDPDKVDNDIVSVYINGKLVFENIKLSDKEIYYNTAITKNTTISFKAINEGYFPPNTSKLIFKDGNKDYLYLNNLHNSNSAIYILNKN